MRNSVRISFPAAVYSKSMPSSKGGARGYEWLHRNPAFSEAAWNAADAWSRCFQWRYGGGKTHAPVAMWAPLEKGALMLHFTDAGPDDQDRPHMLRLEAAWAKPESANAAIRQGFLLQAMRDEAWLNESSSRATVNTALTAPGTLETALAAMPQDTIIGASRNMDGFSLGGRTDMVWLDANTWTRSTHTSSKTCGPDVNTNNADIVAHSADPKPARPATRRDLGWQRPSRLRRPWFWIVTTCVLIIAVIGSGAYIVHDRQRLKALHKENDGLHQQVRQLEVNLRELERTAASLRENLAAVEEALAVAQNDFARERTRFESQAEAKERQIEQLRENAEQATRAQVQRLESMVDKLTIERDELIEKLRQIQELSVSK